jgi:hypothetical protein
MFYKSGHTSMCPAQRKAWTMKHIAGKALGAAAFLTVIVALVAGKDDIRKFHRMHSM